MGVETQRKERREMEQNEGISKKKSILARFVILVVGAAAIFAFVVLVALLAEESSESGTWQDVNNLGQNERLIIAQMYAADTAVQDSTVLASGILEEEFVRTANFIQGRTAVRTIQKEDGTSESIEIPEDEVSWRFTLLPAQGEARHNRETLRLIGTKDVTLVLKRDNPKLFVPKLKDQYKVVENYDFDAEKDEFLVGAFFSNVNQEMVFSPRRVYFRGSFSSAYLMFDGFLSSQELGAPVFVRRHGSKVWEYVGDIAGRSGMAAFVQTAEKALDDFREVAYSTVPAP